LLLYYYNILGTQVPTFNYCLKCKLVFIKNNIEQVYKFNDRFRTIKKENLLAIIIIIIIIYRDVHFVLIERNDK